MVITNEQLKTIYPYSTEVNRQKYLGFINSNLDKYQVNTPLRVSMFLAQIGHESGQFRYNEELASGEAYDTGRLAIALGNTPEKDGDGQLFKGRGLIQITGKSNYIALSGVLGIDLLKSPQLLKDPKNAVISAFWFWQSKNLNKYADLKDINGATKKINGGLNGLQDRVDMYARACKVFGC